MPGNLPSIFFARRPVRVQEKLSKAPAEVVEKERGKEAELASQVGAYAPKLGLA